MGTNFSTGGPTPYLLTPFTITPFDASVYTAYNIVAAFSSSTRPTVPCLCEDMEILTVKGYRRVQDHTVQDYVITPDNRIVPIRSVFQSVVRGDDTDLPVLIPAHYFGKNSPSKDILISPHHAVFLLMANGISRYG